jgi:flavin reductase (DIM6/NTAB) family NADH-FMN oxidoreductase RutF
VTVSKTKMGPLPLIFPTPALLVGANVNDKPNFLLAAWGGVACSEPPMVVVSIRQKNRYTYIGIKQNSTFSINIPSVDIVTEADYCGVKSGSNVDKVDICRFDIFYGALSNAPMIEQCPVNLECSVVHVLSLGSHDLIVGKIEETHVTNGCLTEGKADVEKIKPFAFTQGFVPQYRTMGEAIGKAFSIGLTLQDRT